MLTAQLVANDRLVIEIKYCDMIGHWKWLLSCDLSLLLNIELWLVIDIEYWAVIG